MQVILVFGFGCVVVQFVVVCDVLDGGGDVVLFEQFVGFEYLVYYCIVVEELCCLLGFFFCYFLLWCFEVVEVVNDVVFGVFGYCWYWEVFVVYCQVVEDVFLFFVYVVDVFVYDDGEFEGECWVVVEQVWY